jgi:hypothetical protein
MKPAEGNREQASTPDSALNDDCGDAIYAFTTICFLIYLWLLPITAAMKCVRRSEIINKTKRMNTSKFICYSKLTAIIVFYMAASAFLGELSDYSSAFRL